MQSGAKSSGTKSTSRQSYHVCASLLQLQHQTSLRMGSAGYRASMQTRSKECSKYMEVYRPGYSGGGDMAEEAEGCGRLRVYRSRIFGLKEGSLGAIGLVYPDRYTVPWVYNLRLYIYIYI